MSFSSFSWWLKGMTERNGGHGDDESRLGRRNWNTMRRIDFKWERDGVLGVTPWGRRRWVGYQACMSFSGCFGAITKHGDTRNIDAMVDAWTDLCRRRGIYHHYTTIRNAIHISQQINQIVEIMIKPKIF